MSHRFFMRMLRVAAPVLLATSLALHPAAAADNPVRLDMAVAIGIARVDTHAPHPRRAAFNQEGASTEARHVADWVVDSGDNRNMPFVIVDKTAARVYVFAVDGKLSGAAAALLGSARGDDSVPGIGDRKLSSIRPEERTTPAGRFVAALDRNLHGDPILWVDYDSAVSMHRVITSNARERRLERLNSPSILDNRISYGCINVPVAFFDNIVLPAFKGTDGIVYVLPETKSARAVFASYDVDERVRPPLARGAEPAQVASALKQR